MKLGLSTYALTWSFGISGYEPKTKISLPEFIRRAADLGYQGVQIADNAPLIELSASERSELWRQAKDLGLFVEIGARGMTPANLKAHLEIASEAKSPFLRFVIDGPGFEPGYEELPGLLKTASDQCADRGIILAIENHDRFASPQIASWLDAIGSDYLGICLDTANSYGSGEGFRETIETLMPYTVNFHLKDFVVNRQPHMLGLLIEGTAAGQGLIPIPAILEKLKRQSRCQSVTVEHWTGAQDTIEETIALEEQWCIDSMENLRGFFFESD